MICKMYACPFCTKKFPNMMKLKEHIRSEHDDTTCPVCKRNFLSKYTLKVHLRYHDDLDHLLLYLLIMPTRRYNAINDKLKKYNLTTSKLLDKVRI